MESVNIIDIAFSSTQVLISISVVFLNGVFLIALIKRRSLHTTSNAVLGCLCCSDLLIGVLSLTILPMSILKHIGITYDLLYIILFNVFLLFITFSCVFIVLVNLDRYAAICHPFKYLRYATTRLCAVIATSACLLCAFVVVIAMILDKMYSTYSAAVIFVISVCAMTFILVYCNWKIIKVIRRHKREIASLSFCRHSDGFQREAKKYRITMFLVIIFIICKLPPTLFFMTFVIWKVKATLPIVIWGMLADVLLVLNSFFNPLVYYFSSSVFRNAMKEVLCGQRQG